MEHVESSEWRAYVQELVRKDGVSVLRSLLTSENIKVDMAKKAAVAYFPPNEIDGIIEKFKMKLRNQK